MNLLDFLLHLKGKGPRNRERRGERAIERQQKVELSHFLLVRMCRCIDLWHQHEMEAVLGKLLAEPEALKGPKTAGEWPRNGLDSPCFTCFMAVCS